MVYVLFYIGVDDILKGAMTWTGMVKTGKVRGKNMPETICQIVIMLECTVPHKMSM